MTIEHLGRAVQHDLFQILQPQEILQRVQHLLGMSTAFYAELSETTMLIHAAYHDPLAVERPALPPLPAAMPIEDSYCQFVYRSGHPLTVPQARQTPVFADLPTTKTLNIGSYVGVPLLCHDGSIYGTLCGIDTAATTMPDEALVTLQLFAQSLMYSLEAQAIRAELTDRSQRATAAALDELTGVPNRTALALALPPAILAASQQGRPVTLIFLTIDRLQRLNDLYTLPFGDAVVQQVSTLLRAHMPHGATLFRLSGAKFALLLPEQSATEGDVIAGHIQEQMMNYPWSALGESRHETLRVTLSIGIAAYPEHAANEPLLLQHADDALYRAEDHGGNHVVVARATVPTLIS